MSKKIAIVTGASRGIGQAIALSLAENCVDLLLGYRSNIVAAEIIAQQIRNLGRRVLVMQVNISDRTSIKTMMQAALDNFGQIDILVNNAGILQQKFFQMITDEDWDSMINTNLKGVFLCSQEVFPIMQNQKSGCIVNISSSGGQLGGTLAIHYAASKAGVISLTKSLARIGADHGIRVNCVAPGLIRTEMTEIEIKSVIGQDKIHRQIPLGRSGEANEVAEMVTFLASDKSSYITGQTFNVNGGLYMG